MMIDKITLYTEVLELEPGSRVFFPLAKLLADKEPAEAILILKKGLSRHPDHIEARIFLIELLSANEGDADLDNELDIVSSILRNYPSFWKIWSAHLAQDSELHDAALAINFFGAGLSGRCVTWSDVIAHGLNSLLVDAGDETTPHLPSSAEVKRFRGSTTADVGGFSTKPEGAHDGIDQRGHASDAQPDISFDDVEGRASKVIDGSGAAESVDDLPSTPVHMVDMPDSFGMSEESLQQESPQQKSPDQESSPMGKSLTHSDEASITDASVSSVDFGEEEESEEPFSLRTRTMANLLAEQGDYEGALDIYNELLAVANEDEQRAIADKVQELEALRQQSVVPGTPKKDMGVIADSDGGKLVSLLESLASRFENRAR